MVHGCHFKGSIFTGKAIIENNNLAEVAGNDLSVKHGLIQAHERTCHGFLTQSIFKVMI